MKLFRTASLLFLPLAFAETLGENQDLRELANTNGCAAQSTNSSCIAESTSNKPCYWHGLAGCTGNSEKCPHDAKSESECEGNHDLCMFANNGGGDKVCAEADQGDETKVNGTSCFMMLVDNGNGNNKEDLWVEVVDKGCASGFVCEFPNAYELETISYGEEIEGVCRSTECIGKKIPGNCNGNGARDSDNKDQCQAMTERVTICHRTCSAKNPWVRITIDEDAWNGEGCGHQNHEVEVECKNKAPWLEWGPNRHDYLLKEHGTREDTYIREEFKNDGEEKDYWRKWEPACPYVRNGHCCSWTDATNPCCGIHPDDVPAPLPEIEIRKTSKDEDTPCELENNGMGTELAVAGVGHKSMKYCYFMQNHGNMDLCGVEMSDSSVHAGISGVVITGESGTTGCLKVGETAIVNGAPFDNPATGENTPATVSGTTTANPSTTVTDSDPSAVAPAVIKVEKTCRIAMGAGSGCSNANKGVETAAGTPDDKFECCYKITNKSGNAPDGTPINVCDVKMSDNTSTGGMSTTAAQFSDVTVSGVASNGCFAEGESVWYKGGEFYPDDDSDSGTAKATGLTAIGENPVDDEDPAGAAAGKITIVKTCKVKDNKPCSETAGDDLAVDYVDADMKCCYKIKNPRSVPICNLVLTDNASTNGMATSGAQINDMAVAGDMPDGCLDGESEVVVDGSEFKNPPHKDDGYAKISGNPQGNTDITVQDTDPAGVSPASIGIEKTCKVDDFTSCTESPGDEMAVGKPGDTMQCCYLLTNTSPVKICALELNDNGANGMTTAGAQIDAKVIASGGNMENGCLPKENGSVMVDGEKFTNPGDTDIGTATIKGTPDDGESDVFDEDPAGVSMADIAIKKYAKDNTNSCSNSDFGDDVSVKAPVGKQMKYCYKTTNIGKYKLCDVVMKDESIAAALLGSDPTHPDTLGLGAGADGMEGGCLEVGEWVWSESEGFSNPNDGEGPYDAVVTAVPEGETYPVVEDNDPAAVEADRCPNSGLMGSDLASVCENKGVVILGHHPNFDTPQNLPPDLLADDLKNLFYDIDMLNSDDVVQFSVKNPFNGNVDMYVQYRAGNDDTCAGTTNVAGCGSAVENIEAVCQDVTHINPSATNFAMVTVFFVEKSGQWTINDNAEIDECCEANVPSESNVLSYTFEILCECPGDTSTNRGLRA